MATIDLTCPCGSAKAYDSCCGPYIAGTKRPPTAEALMRSRYSAYVKTQIGYLRDTLGEEQRDAFDEEGARRWATASTWRGLEILSTTGGSASDAEGTVSFVARYAQEGEEREHRELATFRKDAEGRWLFAEASAPPAAPAVRDPSRVGRNEPCSCGSGKKYKKCCGA